MRMSLLIAFAGACVTLHAADAPAQPERQLKIETGKVMVGQDLATIDLPPGYRYLQQSDARYILEEVNHNPPDPTTLGMVLPAEDSKDDWLMSVSFDECGYIKDDDAKTLDYDKMIADMKQEAEDSKEERAKNGYSTYDLLGWAEPPHYDSATKKLYWAMKAQFSDSKQPTVNYKIRVLGRGGVLQFNVIDQFAQLKQVAEAGKVVLAKTELTSGNRYADFKSGDNVAAYGIGGLIAGGVLLKTGLLKVLIKPLIIAGVVVVGFVKKLFGKKKEAA